MLDVRTSDKEHRYPSKETCGKLRVSFPDFKWCKISQRSADILSKY